MVHCSFLCARTAGSPRGWVPKGLLPRSFGQSGGRKPCNLQDSSSFLSAGALTPGACLNLLLLDLYHLTDPIKPTGLANALNSLPETAASPPHNRRLLRNHLALRGQRKITASLSQGRRADDPEKRDWIWSESFLVWLGNPTRACLRRRSCTPAPPAQKSKGQLRQQNLRLLAEFNVRFDAKKESIPVHRKQKKSSIDNSHPQALLPAMTRGEPKFLRKCICRTCCSLYCKCRTPPQAT
ncbi:uncharacterized protein AAEQ78_022013 [Lycaon pictus]